MNVNTSNELRLATMNGSRLTRRGLLSAVFITPAVAAVLASCGDKTKVRDTAPEDTATPDTSATTVPETTATTTPDTTPGTATPDTSVGSAGIEHPTGAEDVILRFGYVGGFVPVGYAFRNVPNALITGDGRLITQGVTTAIFPGPLLPPLDERTITEEGIQTILAAADEAGLLAPPPDYSAEIMVADAADTQLIVNANGGSFTHQAGALGMQDPEASEARVALNEFCITLGDIEALVGTENLGEAAPLVAERYRFQAIPQTAEDLAGYAEEPKPTEVPWPAELGVTLASAAECAEIDAAKVGTLFSDANELTFFVEDGTAYMVAAVAVLPGDTC